MTRRSERLEVVRQLRAREEDTVRQKLVRLSAQREEAGQTLASLDQYTREYQDQLRAGGIHQVHVLQQAQLFLSRLDEARAQQVALIKQLDDQIARVRQAWQQAHCKTDQMGDLVEQARQDEMRQAERRLQTTLDDQSARKFWQNQK
ncbi:MAG: hypothetical protein D6758_07980 [Gammaproteobacteria bacterium]|nr:MAG: hypothetical protein D6758_07980 [Gammaproteobacteria bacterium]